MTSPPGATESGDRWQAHRWAAWGLRALIFLAPLAAAIGVSLWLAPRLFEPGGALQVIGWWLTLVTVSSVAAWAVDRAARRLLPLTTMLRMTLLFPDRAPSRFRVALRRSDLGELRRRVESAHREGASEDRVAGLLLSLANALNRYDRKLRGHGERTRAYADMLAEELKVPADQRDRLRWAALLHDVGKIEIPAEILGKDGPLDESERAIVRRHPLAGMRVAAPLVPWLGEAARAIEEHHEWWDGSGYPRGLSGEEISSAARIVAVADAFDVMTAGRSYQAARSPGAARREIARMAGTQFDPTVARALMNLSLGRLRWMIGPVTWFGQIPFFLDRLGRDFVTVTSAAALTAATIVTSIPYPSPAVAGVTAMAEPAVTTTEGPTTEAVTAPETERRSGESGPIQAGSDSATADSTTTTTDGETPSTSTTTTPPDTTTPTTTPDIPGTTTGPTTTTTVPTTTTIRPTSHDDVVSTPEDRSVSVDVLANDHPGMRLKAITAQPSRGDASMASGKVRYMPRADAHGTDTFAYRACHTNGVCDEATAAVRVTPVNDPPRSRPDHGEVKAGNTVTIKVLANDDDVDGDALTVRSAYGAGSGSLSTDGTAVTYRAASGSSGVDTFTYDACDPDGACASASVTVTVRAAPRPPRAANDTGYYHPGGKERSVNVLANDSHPDGLPLVNVTIVRHPERIEILSVRSGVVAYRASKGRPQDDSFVYRVCDERGLCDTATVTLVKE